MRGHLAYRAAEVSFVHRNPCRTPWRLIRHHFVRGRAHGRMVLSRGAGRPLARHKAPGSAVSYGRSRARLTKGRVELWGGPELRSRFRRSRRLVWAGVAAAALGTCFEVIGPRRPAG